MSVDTTTPSNATFTASATPETSPEPQKPLDTVSKEDAPAKKNGWKTALAATGLLVAVGAALHLVLPKSCKTSEKESA